MSSPIWMWLIYLRILVYGIELLVPSCYERWSNIIKSWSSISTWTYVVMIFEPLLILQPIISIATSIRWGPAHFLPLCQFNPWFSKTDKWQWQKVSLIFKSGCGKSTKIYHFLQFHYLPLVHFNPWFSKMDKVAGGKK